MADERLAEHLTHAVGRGHEPAGAHRGAAGGAACGDLIRIDVAVEGDRVVDAGFEASGCGTMLAAGSAVVDLVRGERVLDAARIGPARVSR
ncbi:MAG TPA: iron-sulfur cluster assembly scaffold protein, partial [Solirubrobacteraceae bacterium]